MKFDGSWCGVFEQLLRRYPFRRCVGALPAVLLSACTLFLDAEKEQCETDEDCWARGLDGATCVRELCQPTAAGSGNSRNTGIMESSAQRQGSSDVEPPPDQTSQPTQGPNGRGPRAEVPPAAAANPRVQSGASAAAGSQPTAAGSAAMLPGAAGAPAIAECVSDADCGPGGQCVDAVCWAATSQCSQDGDCVSMGPEFEGGRCVSSECRPNPRWRCEAVQATSTTEQKQLKLLVRDSLSLGPVAMVHIVACQKLDLMCTNPIAEGTTDRDGQLAITVPANFAGYLQQTERMEYAPAMYFLPTVFPEDGVLQPFPLLTAGAIIDALATSLGARIDPDRGHMMLIAEDCMGMAQAGMTFMSPQADDKSVQFYVRDLLPSTSATETAEIGNGGFLNFMSGTAVINVDRVEGMLHLATVTIVVRPGFISVAYMRPQLRVLAVP